MAKAKKLIMAWSKCTIGIAPTGEDDAMGSPLRDIGIISDKSTTLSAEDGEKLEAKGSGGIIHAMEEGEHVYTVSTRVKEPTFEFESYLTGAQHDDTKDELKVDTNIIERDFSMVLTPKNVGATGIRARRTHIVYKPGYSEEEGQYADITFTILVCEDGEHYTKFKKKA